MIYYKNTEGDVFAYPKSDLDQVDSIQNTESELVKKEAVYLDAQLMLANITAEIEMLIKQFNQLHAEDTEENPLNNEIEELSTLISSKADERANIEQELSQAESNFIDVKSQYDSILPVFFDIREKTKSLKKMSTKEVDAHLNPPIPKEQLIVEAEQQKQLCSEDAEKNITILERKVRLNMATDEDKNNLATWEIYSINVSDIDASLAPDIEWPEKPH